MILPIIFLNRVFYLLLRCKWHAPCYHWSPLTPFPTGKTEEKLPIKVYVTVTPPPLSVSLSPSHQATASPSDRPERRLPIAWAGAAALTGTFHTLSQVHVSALSWITPSKGPQVVKEVCVLVCVCLCVFVAFVALALAESVRQVVILWLFLQWHREPDIFGSRKNVSTILDCHEI